MKLYTETDQYKLYEGSMLDMLDVIPENSVDAIVTDPPYELNFMNKGWDRSGIAFQKETWEKCLKVLKPGGYLLSFGGSRTFHRIACAIEDAGFEIRDTIMWLVGSGFPKSMSIGKAVEAKLTTGSANSVEFKHLDGEKSVAGGWGINKYRDLNKYRDRNYDEDAHLRTTKVNYTTEEGKRWDGWGTALKPAFESITVARKPCEGSTTDNVLKYGVGGINIDECRISTDDILVHGGVLRTNSGDDRTGKSLGMFQDGTENTFVQNPNGRFPANVILTYNDSDFDEVCGGMPYTKSTGGSGEASASGGLGNNIYGKYNHDVVADHLGGLGDEGSAARYFYCAKASKLDRDEGLPEGTHNIHPTLKPINLMRYLVRLVSPKGSTILDPFNGSGSTGKAVMLENRTKHKDYKYIGIDLSEEYLAISKARIDYALTADLTVDQDDKITLEKYTDENGKVKPKQFNIFDF